MSWATLWIERLAGVKWANRTALMPLMSFMEKIDDDQDPAGFNNPALYDSQILLIKSGMRFSVRTSNEIASIGFQSDSAAVGPRHACFASEEPVNQDNETADPENSTATTSLASMVCLIYEYLNDGLIRKTIYTIRLYKSALHNDQPTSQFHLSSVI